jgi:hypothetical protein
MLDVPDGGDGGNDIQATTRRTLRDMKGEKIIIKSY